ncbi:MAG: NTP transferase domain-containing protein [Planctomycetota bacterium]|jgi:nitroreductase/CTP:molybdopterin cytidylyltransferase MocA
MTRCCAIIPAAGKGVRMGVDKALAELGGRSLISRVVGDCRTAGIENIIVVRGEGSMALPGDVQGQVQHVSVPAGGEMIDSIRAGVANLPADCAHVVVFPVDYALAGAETVALLSAQLVGGAEIVLPICAERPGHPIGLARRVAEEVADPGVQTLRDVIGRDPSRVRGVSVHNAWVLRDLDTPNDLQAAAAFLRCTHLTPTELMRAHRSRRSYHPDPIADEQLQWIIDSARYAPTSSFIQAYSVVAVCDPIKKAEVARLCANQHHIHEAPVFLAICADLHKLKLCCERNGMDLRAQNLEIFMQASIDASLVGQNLQLAAESEGLGSCLLGAARNHPVQLAELLGLPRHVYVVFGMVIGKAKDDPVPRGRMPLAGVLHRESYRTDHLEEIIDAADADMRAWARRTNTERGGSHGRPVNEEKGWSDRMAGLWGRDRDFRTALATELAALGFGCFEGP